MMGEYPPLSDQDIAAISQQRVSVEHLTLESGLVLGDAVISIEHLGT
jgi:hypothetical protein